MGKLFTVGYTHHTLEELVLLLKNYDINYLLDVRSIPYSRYAPQFNREAIEKSLNCNQMNYVFMGKYFGARQSDLTLYTKEGYLDFDKTRNTDYFRKAVENVKLGLSRGNRIAFMCAEHNPIDCHRTILVSKAFYDEGIGINHIIEKDVILSQDDINEKLLNMYFPDRQQLDLFEYMNNKVVESDQELLEKAYQLRNRDIGFHLYNENKQNVREGY